MSTETRTGMEAPNCPVCSQTGRLYKFHVHGMRLEQCAGCGLVSRAAPHEGGDVHPFPAWAGPEPPEPPPLETSTERLAARAYIAELRLRMPACKRVLLVAQPGHPCVKEFSAAGFEVSRHLSAAELDGGQDIGDSADAVVVLGELERSSRPDALLQRLRKSLKPGGVLLLTAQLLDSWAARFFRHQWIGWRMQKRYYFDRKTLHLLLLRNGFRDAWMEPERRSYTIQHIAERAAESPRTALTIGIAWLHRLMPNRLRAVHIPLATSGILLTAAPGDCGERLKVSVVVPVFNEKATFKQLMDTLLAHRIKGADREIILVESNSTDGTREQALSYGTHPEVRLLLQDRPRGKGYAVREGFAAATGDILMIQDADLEYDINDYDMLLEPLLKWQQLFVLGARHGGSWKMRAFRRQPLLSTMANLAHLFFTGLLNVAYGGRMKDPLTMYKVFFKDCLYGVALKCCRFDFDYELVITLLKKGYAPIELPVNYASRSFSQGKKVKLFPDPFIWLWTILKHWPIPLRRCTSKEDGRPPQVQPS
jgi:hypothetical protein